MKAGKDTTWAQNTVLRVFADCGTWAAVAQEMAPFLDLSPAAWWYVGRGWYATPAKIAALRAYDIAKNGRQSVGGRHPRTSIEVDLDTYALLAACKQPGETWPACLRRLAGDPR